MKFRTTPLVFAFSVNFSQLQVTPQHFMSSAFVQLFLSDPLIIASRQLLHLGSNSLFTEPGPNISFKIKTLTLHTGIMSGG
jgi:hypothetical protein